MKANGAGAVILQLAINGAERTEVLMDEAAEFGLESLFKIVPNYIELSKLILQLPFD